MVLRDGERRRGGIEVRKIVRGGKGRTEEQRATATTTTGRGEKRGEIKRVVDGERRGGDGGMPRSG
jgi:hypothetical protein